LNDLLTAVRLDFRVLWRRCGAAEPTDEAMLVAHVEDVWSVVEESRADPVAYQAEAALAGQGSAG